MCSYLKNRKQRVLIKNIPSTIIKVVTGVLQGSIDGLLLFHIFMNGIFLFMQYTIVGTYFDDSNVSISGSNKEKIVKIITFRLRINSVVL